MIGRAHKCRISNCHLQTFAHYDPLQVVFSIQNVRHSNTKRRYIVPDTNMSIGDSCMAINSSGNWQSMPCDHEYTVVCQQNKSKVAVTTSMPQTTSSITLGKNNRFLHGSLLKIWDFFHECEKFRLFTSGA